MNQSYLKIRPPSAESPLSTGDKVGIGFDDGDFGESTREQVEDLNSEWLMEGYYPSTGSVATLQFVINLKTEIKKRGVDPNKAANIPCGSTEYPKL